MVSTSSSAGPSRASHTQRKDWTALVEELFVSVVSGAPFGVGVIGKHKGLLGASLKLRLNQRFPQPQVQEFIRKHFQVRQLDRLFERGDGLEPDPSGAYKVEGGDLGLPRNTLVSLFQNPADANLRGVILFGGQRMEGQLEKRMQAARAILESTGRSSARGGLALDSRDQLEERLSKINVKRLFDYDIELLARIVNGLEEVREELPLELKPTFKAISDFVIRQKTRQGVLGKL
jgi:hypothetical protein